MSAVDAVGEAFEDDFDGEDLDLGTWLPHYLPAWSSRALTAARYEVRDSSLRLFVPPDHGVWCADDHLPPIRVSGIQSGSFSGPVGSTVGQQPYRTGLLVREQQPQFWGWTPSGGLVEIRARMILSPRSMAAFWLVGLEDRPERCAEICVAEVFGNAVRDDGTAAVGMGVHAFRDPAATEDFEAVRLPLDVAAEHDYAVQWRADRADFLVDGVTVRSTRTPPTYPMQLMLAVFDFPQWSNGADDDAVPELVVERVRGRALAP